MDTKALRVFLSVADTLNYSRSSEALHISLSAISRMVQRLEQELGQRLLERDNRSMRLTAAGREFRVFAQRTLEDLQQLRQQFGRESELAGQISLFCSVTASYRILAPILEAYRAAYPAVELMLHTGDQADGIDKVRAGFEDFSVSGRPRDLPSKVDFLPLLTSPVRFCVPAGDYAFGPLPDTAVSRASELDWSRIPFIVPERGATKALLDDWFRAQGIRPNIYAQVAGHEAIVAMVALGLGVGIAPELVVDASGMADSIRYLEFSEGLPPLTIGLCALRQRLESPLVRSLWQVAAETYSLSI